MMRRTSDAVRVLWNGDLLFAHWVDEPYEGECENVPNVRLVECTQFDASILVFENQQRIPTYGEKVHFQTRDGDVIVVTWTYWGYAYVAMNDI